MINFSQYLYESLDDIEDEDSSFYLSDEDKNKLITLDKKYNEVYKILKNGWNTKEVENIDSECKKFLDARKQGKEYFPILKLVGENKYEVDGLKDKAEELLEEFENFDCFLSKYYIYRLKRIIWKVDFAQDPKKYAKEYIKYQSQTPSKEDYKAALQMIKENPYEKVNKNKKNISAKEAAKIFQNYIDKLDYGWKVKLSDSIIPRASVSTDKVFYIKSDSMFSDIDIESLKQHEIRGHIARRYYGLKTGLYLFLYGLYRSNDFDEGIAIYNSLNKCEKVKPNVKFNIALKTVVCYWLTKKNFCELFDFCRKLDNTISDEAIFKVLVRFKRELQDCSVIGGNGDDQSYFCGYQKVNKMTDEERDDILKYNIGPEQLEDLPKIKEFLKVNKFHSLI